MSELLESSSGVDRLARDNMTLAAGGNRMMCYQKS